MKMKKLSPAAAYAAGIGIALAVGLISALASMEGMKRFAQLSQPPLAPPGWLFPVVWTALYTLMGISAARVYLKNTMDTRPALLIWSAQLIVNALWSPLFFSLGLRLAAFVWLLILIVLVVRMIADFKKIDIPIIYAYVLNCISNIRNHTILLLKYLFNPEF